MKKFEVLFEEEVIYMCSVEIEANSKKEALEKFYDGEYDEHSREEFSNSIDVDHTEVREIEE
jgi:hypothetical protein